MVTKKKTGGAKKKAAPKAAAKRTYKKKSEASYIPGAMATAALVAVNYDGLVKAADYVQKSSSQGLVKGVENFAMGTGSGAKQARARLIGKEALVKDAIAIGGGYLAGEIVRKYAPSVIKKPIAKISKKIPRVVK